MKAIDIIDAMTFDPELAESSSLWKFYEDESVASWAKRIFGDYHIKEGVMLPGYYLAAWQCDVLDLPFKAHNKPDVTLTRDDPSESDEDDQEIYLWRIEE